MFHMSVPKLFWNDAISTTYYLINRVHSLVLPCKTPYFIVPQKKPLSELTFLVLDVFLYKFWLKVDLWHCISAPKEVLR